MTDCGMKNFHAILHRFLATPPRAAAGQCTYVQFHWITRVWILRVFGGKCAYSPPHSWLASHRLSFANVTARGLTLVPVSVCARAGEHVGRNVMLRCDPPGPKSHARNRARVNFSPSSSRTRRARRGPDKKRISMIDLSQCRLARSPRIRRRDATALLLSVRGQTSYRTSKISRSSRSDCRRRLIVTVATLDRFSNFDMTLKK